MVLAVCVLLPTPGRFFLHGLVSCALCGLLLLLLLLLTRHKKKKKPQAEMEEAAFSMNMESAAANKLQPDNTLSEEAQRHWPEIYSRRRAFHVNVAEAVEIRGLEKSAVLQTYEEW